MEINTEGQKILLTRIQDKLNINVQWFDEEGFPEGSSTFTIPIYKLESFLKETVISV